MTAFFAAVALLLVGYAVYGRVVERVFVIRPERPTPCCEYRDDCDFMPMPAWKVFFIQLLDIAGLGPVFGPILGALYGPAALLWIVLGCIFAGGVHDYMSGMLSVRSKGESIPEVVGNFMGLTARQVMRVFSVVLLLLVGVVFVLGPAKLLASMTGLHVQFLVACIFCYYFLATILPINVLIGRLYPVFGALLLFMSLSVLGGLALEGYSLPPLDFAVNTHPDAKPIWPLLFITLSCGAVSGFHSTQSPLMARCIKNERSGRLVFYGAMIMEGIIALVWATAGMAFYESPGAMQAVIDQASPAGVVNQVCKTLLGPVGGVLAILGVVVLPITSGDTAFRSTRLILADAWKLPQTRAGKRLLIAVPLFVVAFIISTQDFAVIWRYFGWSNQTLAALVLWAGGAYLAREGRLHWICTVPAAFMTAVISSFILQADIGLNLPVGLSNVLGVLAGLVALVTFVLRARKRFR